jgi:DNA-binding SARP family transcriptional activator
LIALGGSQVREDQLEDFLWPDADGDKAHMSFMMTLHRLRQVLGHEKAVQHKEGRMTLENSYCWIDIRAFEHILEEADRHWKSGQDDEAIRCTEKAVSLHRGPFLPEWEDEPLALSLRERLRSRLIRSATRLASHWEKAGQPEKAVEWYEKVLEVNALIEELYQRLMACYEKMGRKAEALSTYQRCRKVLSSALGIDPSPKTEALYRSLLAVNRRTGGREKR